MLLESLLSNHTPSSRNNRIGCFATVVFPSLNDIALEASDDAYDLVIGASAGPLRTQTRAAHLTRRH